MTEFKIINDGEHFILDITGIKHIFVTEDETCAEIRITKSDINRLKELRQYQAGKP
jgi:hypothetical protein